MTARADIYEWLNMYGAVRGTRALYAYLYGAGWRKLVEISEKT